MSTRSSTPPDSRRTRHNSPYWAGAQRPGCGSRPTKTVLDDAPESQTLIWVVCMFVRQRLTRHAKNADLNACHTA
jgi:hypothetical protein